MGERPHRNDAREHTHAHTHTYTNIYLARARDPAPTSQPHTGAPRRAEFRVSSSSKPRGHRGAQLARSPSLPNVAPRPPISREGARSALSHASLSIEAPAALPGPRGKPRVAPGGGSSLANACRGPRQPIAPHPGSALSGDSPPVCDTPVSPGVLAARHHSAQLPGSPAPRLLLAARSRAHSARSRHRYAGGAARRRPLQPTLPRQAPRVPAQCPISAPPPVSRCPGAFRCSGRPSAQTSQLQRARSPHPRAPRGPREETKVSRRRPGLAPAPARAAEVSKPGAAPAQQTLQTCPGSQDAGSRAPRGRSSGAGAVDRCPEALSPLSGPRTALALPLSGAHPRPLPLPERPHLHSGRRPLPPAAAALTSSSFLLLARDTSCI